MSTPSRLSGGMCVWFTLSVVISNASLVLAACKTTIQPSTSNTEMTAVTKMTRSFVPGEALVKFKPSLSQERMDAILKESGTELITVIQGIGVQHVRIVGKESVESVVKKLSTFQEVEYAEPNVLSRTDR
jgi:hypothetical protein